MRLRLTDRVLNNHVEAGEFVRKGKPRWLRMQLPQSKEYYELVKMVREHDLHTVCQEAACPNMGECWSNGVATLMILGDVCTRSCGFCNIKTGAPPALDLEEPGRVAKAVRIMNLKYVVITSVNRDELADGGAGIWAETIRQTKAMNPQTKVEVLIPDFCGDEGALDMVLEAGPDVVNHNLETVKRLYKAVRPQAKYGQSMEVLRRIKEKGFVSKTGIMVGIGERDEEVTELMEDLVEMTKVGDGGWCDILTIGQYLQPTERHLPVNRFVHPDQFEVYKRLGEEMGIGHVESGPMVRSSYHADKQAAGVGG